MAGEDRVHSGTDSAGSVLRDRNNASARFRDAKTLMETTPDLQDDSVSTQNAINRESETAVSERMASSSTSRLRNVTQSLKWLTSSSSKRFSRVDTNKSGAARAFLGLKFMSKNVRNKAWSEVETGFNDLAVGGLLPRSQFGKCIGMVGSGEFAGHLFDGLARRRGVMSSSVTKDELRHLWEQLADQSFDARLQTFFDLVDKDADGRITGEEVKEIICLSASANKLSTILDRADEYTALIMEELDPLNIGYIEIDSLEMLLLQTPNPTRVTNNHNLTKILDSKVFPTKETTPFKLWYRKVNNFIEDYWRQVWVMALWLSICAGLFTWKFVQYRNREVFNVMGYCVSMAKGAAETLKFNMALILLPVCRKTITWLRRKTKLGVVVPFNDNINFHKVIAAGIGIGVVLHASTHLACDFPRLLHTTNEQYEPMKVFFGEDRPPNYWWFVKGTEGWTGLAMVALMAIPFTLAQSWFRTNKLELPKHLKKLIGFNAFWYTHHLFVIVYALLIIHGINLYLSKEWYKKTTWMYLAVPITLYACERLFRSFGSRFKTVRVVKVVVHSKNVLELHMSKPQGFEYRSGQYMFVKCPAVSSFEWHPFSITSSPADDYLSVHIRALGDWTSQITTLFSKICQPVTGDRSLLKADMTQGNDIPGLPKLRIDGPYGAPAQDYSEYDVLLLVGLGIGATPLISIVKDVLNNIEHQKELEEGVTENNNRKPFATSRAYFYWVTREQGSFDWFKGVLNEVADNDRNRVIELNSYCSSVYEEGDARSAVITMLQSLHHAKNGIDVVSGTHVKTHFARPNWKNVFKGIADNHPNQRVGVFYCGDARLVGELRQKSQDFSRETTTRFDFHKENF